MSSTLTASTGVVISSLFQLVFIPLANFRTSPPRGTSCMRGRMGSRRKRRGEWWRLLRGRGRGESEGENLVSGYRPSTDSYSFSYASLTHTIHPGQEQSGNYVAHLGEREKLKVEIRAFLRLCSPQMKKNPSLFVPLILSSEESSKMYSRSNNVWSFEQCTKKGTTRDFFGGQGMEMERRK